MDESKTDPDWNSFYSTDYTSHTSYRPLLTVTYSYSLPTGLSNGGIYSFQNVGSNSIMNVHNGTNANDTNVYQVNTSPSGATNAQKFKLDYVSSMDCYYLRAMCSSSGTNRVLDIVKTDGFVEDGGNVQIYKPVDDLAQYWLIIHLGGGEFLLLPRTNANLVLTAYGNSNGTSGGQTSTSAGNIFVSYYNGSDYQKWKIYDHSSGGYVIPNNGSPISLYCSAPKVAEGFTRTITAITNPSNLPVTWSSSAPSVATVNSQGVVTGVAAKTSPVTITASVTLPNSTTCTATCQIYVTIPDGVYYIKNINSNHYLQVKDGKMANGTDVIQYTKYGTGYSDVTKLRQMWKVKYLEDGKYSIRPMNKLDRGLDVTSGNVDIWSVATSDTLSSVPVYAQWTIERYSGSTSGLIFKNKGQSDLTMQVNNASTSINASIVASQYSSTGNCRWMAELITTPPSGIILYDTETSSLVYDPIKYVAPEEICSLDGLHLVAAVYSGNVINQTVTWTSGNETIASVESATGEVTGAKPGMVAITASKSIAGVYPNPTVSYTLITTEIANGTYFMRNKGTSRYVDIEGPTMAAGTNIHQWDFHGGDSQRWIFTHLGNGYYSIKSANSTENYYLGVENDSSAADAPIVLRTGTLTNGMKWRIEASTSVAFKIIPGTGQLNGCALAVASSPSNSIGLEIVQRQYVNDEDYVDEWFVTTEINFGFSTDNYTDGCLYGERQSYRYANRFFNKITNQVSQSIFGKVHHYNMDSNRTASKNDYSLNGAFSNNIDFMIYIGHGLTAIDNKGNRLHYNCDFNGNYHTSDHNDEDYNAYSSNMHFGSSESKLRWVWLYTCNFLTTGDHVDDADLKNMMTGAHIVMGYASTAYLCDNMVEEFAFHLRNGEPIISAYFRAGYEGEASATSDHHLQKVLYIPQAINETIYSPNIHYSYNSSDVLAQTHDIQEFFN